MSQATFKRLRNLLLGLLISGLFLWLALRDLDWPAVGEVLRDAQWGYLPIIFAIWGLGLGARAIRWRVLLGGQVKLASAFHILNIGFLINNTLPFRVGEVVRAYLIERDESPVSGWAALSTIVAERILDMLCVVLMMAAVLPVLPVDPAAVTGGLIMGSVALTGFVVLLIFAHYPARVQGLSESILRFLPDSLRSKLVSTLARMLSGLKPLTTWRGLLGAVLWTGIAWLCSVAGSWLTGLVFPALPQTAVIRAALTLSVVAASFSIIIPFTLASVGPFEAASIFALMTANVQQPVAVAYSVVWHAGVVVTYAIFGVIGLLALGLSLGQVQREAATFGEKTAEPLSE